MENLIKIVEDVQNRIEMRKDYETMREETNSKIAQSAAEQICALYLLQPKDVATVAAIVYAEIRRQKEL